MCFKFFIVKTVTFQIRNDITNGKKTQKKRCLTKRKCNVYLRDVILKSGTKDRRILKK